MIHGGERVIVDGTMRLVKTGDIVMMKAGCKHTVIADTEILMIEVQLGTEISVADKKKFEME